MKTESVIDSFQKIKADYAAAQPSRYRRSRSGLGGTADAHLGYSYNDLWRMREYARDMVRNDAVIGQALERAANNILRTGLRLEPQTSDPELNNELWSLWNEWATNPRLCDARGMFTFSEMERLALMSRWIDGDVFGNPIDEGMLQMIEADRCVTPTNTSKNVVHGVLLNELDRPIEFWFAKASVGKDRLQHVSRVSDTVPYSAWTEEGDPAIFHVFKAGRYSQTRGVPVFAPVFDVCGQFEDLNFAKLVQAQVVSCVGAFLEMDGAVQLGPRTDETDDDGTTKRLEKLHPGMIVKLRPGQKLSQFSPNVPNAEYFDHVRLILRLIGANIGLPLTLVLLDTHDTTFHGYRGELEQARIGFEVEQQRFPNQFNRPCNRWKIREWVRNGKLKGAVVQKMFASGEIFKHKWQAPGWPYVDPLKDANADTIIMEKMLESPRGLHARRGRDYDDVLQETVEDNGKLLSAMESKAIELNNQYPSARFTWRDVLNPRLYLFRDDEPPLQDTATDQTQPAPRRKSTESPSKNGAHRFQEALS